MTTTLTVLVTGASSGIGRATATEFARQGHLVFAAARREDVLAGLAAAAPNIQADGLDVRHGSGQADQHLLPACRGKDQMPLPGELGRRRPPDS